MSVAETNFTNQIADRHAQTARLYAAAAAIAPLFPRVAEALTARIRNTDSILRLAMEAEALQATLILGCASTPKGNRITEKNLDAQWIEDPTGAVKVLRNEAKNR